MISAWLCGFIVGILLGKSGIFFYPQNILDQLHHSIILLPAVFFWLFGSQHSLKTKTVLAVLGALWGNCHAAPFYVGPCIDHAELRVNSLQFNRGPAIVRINGTIFEAKTADKSIKIGARYAGPDLMGMRVLPLNCRIEARESKSVAFRRFVFDYYLERGGSSELVGWADAAVFGSQKNLPMRITNAFKKTGLVHLLVVSGLHVILIAGFVLWMMRLPFQLFYVATVLSPRVWNIVLVSTEFLSAFLIVAYVLLIDAPQAAQRSGVFFLVWVFGKNIFGIRRPLDRFAACMMIQSFVFPIGFISSGNIMSWAATLFLVAKHNQKGENQNGFSFLFDWRLQLKIMCLSSVVFSELSLLSLPANLILGSAFGMTLYVTVVNLIFPFPFVSLFTAEFVNAFLEIIVKICYLTSKYRWLYFEIAVLPWWTQLFGVIASGILILNSLRDLSIRSVEQ
jgi:hypothetical protein